MQQDPNLYHQSLNIQHNYNNNNNLPATIYSDPTKQNSIMSSASTSNAMDVGMVGTPAGSTPGAAATPGASTALGAASTNRRKLSGRYALADFTVERTLGTGSFGRVHLARSRHNMRFYAIKVSVREREMGRESMFLILYSATGPSQGASCSNEAGRAY